MSKNQKSEKCKVALERMARLQRSLDRNEVSADLGGAIAFAIGCMEATFNISDEELAYFVDHGVLPS